MSDEKLDLILTVVSDIKSKIEESDMKAGNFDTYSQDEIIGERLDRLEQEIIFNRTETLDNRRKIKELETRLSRFEETSTLTA